MTLRDDIQRAVREAMKAKDQASLETMRMLWAAIRNEEISQRVVLSPDAIVAVISRQVKQLQDSLKDFTAGGRIDLVDKTNAEIALLATYLPEQLSDERLRAAVDLVIAATGAAGAGDLGKVMGAVMKEVKGTADGNRVRAMVALRLERA